MAKRAPKAKKKRAKLSAEGEKMKAFALGANFRTFSAFGANVRTFFAFAANFRSNVLSPSLLFSERFFAFGAIFRMRFRLRRY